MIKSKVADQSGDLTIVEDVRGNIQAGSSETSMLWVFKFTRVMQVQTLRVQVPNNHILTQSQYYNYFSPKPKYLIFRYINHGPSGKGIRLYFTLEENLLSLHLTSGGWSRNSMQAQLEQNQSLRDSIV